MCQSDCTYKGNWLFVLFWVQTDLTLKEAVCRVHISWKVPSFCVWVCTIASDLSLVETCIVMWTVLVEKFNACMSKPISKSNYLANSQFELLHGGQWIRHLKQLEEDVSSWAYGKAGNGNEMKTGNRNGNQWLVHVFLFLFPFPVSISSFRFQFPFHFHFLLFHMPSSHWACNAVCRLWNPVANHKLKTHILCDFMVKGIQSVFYSVNAFCHSHGSLPIKICLPSEFRY